MGEKKVLHQVHNLFEMSGTNKIFAKVEIIIILHHT